MFYENLYGRNIYKVSSQNAFQKKFIVSGETVCASNLLHWRKIKNPVTENRKLRNRREKQHENS